MIIWIFGDSGVGKKTLIRNLTSFNSSYKNNQQIRSVFGLSDDDIILPVIIQYKKNSKRLNVFTELYENDSKQISYIIHGQYYDFGDRVLNQLKKLKTFKTSKCYYLIPTEKDFIQRRVNRKLGTDYKRYLEQSKKDIDKLKNYFKEVKILNL